MSGSKWDYACPICANNGNYCECSAEEQAYAEELATAKSRIAELENAMRDMRERIKLYNAKDVIATNKLIVKLGATIFRALNHVKTISREVTED